MILRTPKLPSPVCMEGRTRGTNHRTSVIPGALLSFTDFAHRSIQADGGPYT
jgi:hypothetical protein